MSKSTLLEKITESWGGKTFDGNNLISSYVYGGISGEIKIIPENIVMCFKKGNYLPRPVNLHQRYELIVCMRERCCVGIDFEHYFLSPNEAILVFPFQAHYHPKMPREDNIMTMAVTFEFEYSNDKVLMPLRNKVIMLTGKDCDLLAEMTAIGLNEDENKEEVPHILSRFLCRALSRHWQVHQAGNLKNYKSDIYSKTIEYIKDNLEKPFNVKDIALDLNLTETHLRRVFKQNTGSLSLGMFIKNLRIKLAYEKLMHTDINIQKIAENCGFSDQFVFSRAFKRYTGLSPTQYRQKYRMQSSQKE